MRSDRSFVVSQWYHSTGINGSIVNMAMTLRLTDDQDRALTLLAEMTGTSKHEAVVRAIISTAARTVDTEEVRELARSRVPEYADLVKKVRAKKARR
jgi:hypothetical protein